MWLLLTLVSVTWTKSLCKECSTAVHSAAHIVIITDVFPYSYPPQEDLAVIRQLAENLQTPNIKIQIHILTYESIKVAQYIKDTQALGALSYVTYHKWLSKCITSNLWDSFPQSATSPVPRVLVIIPEYPIFMDIKSTVWELKRAGVEIFAVGFKKSLDSNMEEIVSGPPQTHMYEWMKTVAPGPVISQLTKHICLNIEKNHHTVKKALLSQVRLVNGTHPCEGRVEVLYKDTWGWLSDSRWDRQSADVICRQLKCGPSVDAPRGDHFGLGVGPVLRKAECGGHENDLSQCVLGAWDEPTPQDEVHGAGVICLSTGLGSLKLVNGSGACDGTVQVTVNQTLSGVCVWNIGIREAALICRQLGCGPLLHIHENMMGSDVRTVENIFCSGKETDLSECGLSLWSAEPCYLNLQAGIVCSAEAPSKVKLVKGGMCSGQVKVYHNDSWSSVCSDDWDVHEDIVVCRQMGCGPVIETKEGKRNSKLQSPKSGFQGVYCSGRESSLSECASVNSNTYMCDMKVAEVFCSHSGVSNVTLVNGSSQCSGRVQVYYQGRWGTVCDDRWDLSDANVVCRQLGCGAAINASKGAYFGAGSGPIWLEKVYCNGSESHLSKCGAVTSDRGRCTHAQDAGIICAGNKLFEL